MDKLIAMAKTFGQELTTADEELKQVKGELKELQDIMLNNMTELTSKNELHKECEKLTEENEKLKEELRITKQNAAKKIMELQEEIASNPWTKLDLPNGKHTWQRISN